MLTRDYQAGWHFSICCVTSSGYRGYQAEEGEYWLGLIFGPYRERVTESWAAESVIGSQKGVMHFMLPCDWTDQRDAAVILEGLP